MSFGHDIWPCYGAEALAIHNKSDIKSHEKGNPQILAIGGTIIIRLVAPGATNRIIYIY